MRIALVITVLMLALAGGLAAQTATNAAAGALGVADRYDTEVESWRLIVMNWLLKGQDDKLKDMQKAMREFSITARSYVDYKRKGQEIALELYYRNIENLGRLEQLAVLLADYRREYKDSVKDWMGKYQVAEADFKDFDGFEKVYEKTMDRWRGEFEAAMKAGKLADVHQLRADMQLLRYALSAFLLFPGKSADKVPQLQVMENDLRHGVVQLKLHEETLVAKK